MNQVGDRPLNKNVRAIIVDDSRVIRTVIARQLRELGFEILEAGNGREALDTLAANQGVDLALIDWNMPEMNGYELVCALRKNPAYDQMRITMVTSETELGHVQLALEAGASEYLMKPFTRESLVEKLTILGLVAV